MQPREIEHRKVLAPGKRVGMGIVQARGDPLNADTFCPRIARLQIFCGPYVCDAASLEVHRLGSSRIGHGQDFPEDEHMYILPSYAVRLRSGQEIADRNRPRVFAESGIRPTA